MRSSCSSSERNALRAEADAQLVALGAHVHDLGEVEAHRPLVALQLVPSATPERRVERLQLLVLDAQREHLSALEADADAMADRAHACASRPAAGSTSSVS